MSDGLRERLRDWNARCDEILSAHAYHWPDEQTHKEIVEQGSALATALRAELGIEIVYRPDGEADDRERVARRRSRPQTQPGRRARHYRARRTGRVLSGMEPTHPPGEPGFRPIRLNADNGHYVILIPYRCNGCTIATPLQPSALPPLIWPAQPS
ncbi:hypothetical protein [Pseudactinotalea terrae]|uniref:hypothetical protein n=1 Tax=Pseudactinotalea terrae TaxID=1743262 RepID=UPI0012E20A48|nr:hypothetical protein [Pseudactinotalea terrae]